MTLGRPLLPGSKTPLAPSPNHFGLELKGENVAKI